MSSETLIVPGGDLLTCYPASGYTNKPLTSIAPEKLHIGFKNAPKAMRTHYKRNGILLWHRNSAGPAKVISGRVSDTDLTPHPTSAYMIEGYVSDPTGHYLPRAFSFTLGNTTEHAIGLYHSSLGARFTQAGGVYGRAGFANGTVAAWALINLTVTPSLGPALKFVAQTDAHGEFRLPLDRLPAVTKDAPSSKYSAKLEVKAMASAQPEMPLDPDTLTAVQVAKGKTGNGKSSFGDHFTFDITPGTVVRVVSPEHTQIVLKST